MEEAIIIDLTEEDKGIVNEEKTQEQTVRKITIQKDQSIILKSTSAQKTSQTLSKRFSYYTHDYPYEKQYEFPGFPNPEPRKRTQPVAREFDRPICLPPIQKEQRRTAPVSSTVAQPQPTEFRKETHQRAMKPRVYNYASKEEALEARRKRRIAKNKARKRELREELKAKLKELGQMTEISKDKKESPEKSREQGSLQASQGGVSVSSLINQMEIDDEPEPEVTIHPTPSNVLQDSRDEFDELDLEEEDVGRRPFYIPENRKRTHALSVALPPSSGQNGPPDVRQEDYWYDAPNTALRFYTIRDKWFILDRELRLQNIYLNNTIQDMPRETVQDMAFIANSVNFRGDYNDRFCAIYDKKPTEWPPVVKLFIENVEATRVLSLNTEGTSLMRKENGRLIDRVMITVGASNGTVLFFNQHDLLPSKIRNFIENPRFTKIGSGLEKEMKELARVKIQARNWVEIGCLRMALYPPAWKAHEEKVRKAREAGNSNKVDISFGIPSMVGDLVEARYMKDYKRTEYDPRWERSKSGINREFLYYGRPPKQMWPHILENARIPFAEMILIVETFARSRGYNQAMEPFWPIAYEALDICRLRDPKVFQANIIKEPHKNHWMAHPTTTDDAVVLASLPATCHEMTDFFRARADFRERYIRKSNPERDAADIYERFFGKGKLTFPTHAQITKFSPADIIKTKCSSCGKDDHRIESCQQKDPVCVYPHDGFEYPKHSTLCCPHLHSHCRRCQMLGHKEESHFQANILMTPRELRRRFLENMVKGFLTSVPLLALHPTGRMKLTTMHWKLSIDNRRFIQAVIGRYELGITEHQLNNSISFHKKEKSSLEFKTRREYLMKLVQENLLKEDCTHKRIKRDVLKNVVVKKADLNEKIVVEAKGPTREEREEEERILEEARQEMLRTKERYEKLMAKRRKIESSPEKPQTHPSTSTSSQKSVHRK